MSAILTETVSLTSTSRTHIVFAWLSEYIKIVTLRVLHAHFWSFFSKGELPGACAEHEQKQLAERKISKDEISGFLPQFGGGPVVSTRWHWGRAGFVGSDA